MAKKQKVNTIAEHLQDPFFDNYESEGLECYEILKLVSMAKTELVTIVINKYFLKKLTKSHIYFIREIEEKGNKIASRH